MALEAMFRMLASSQHRETESVMKSPTPQWAQQRQLLCHNQKFPAENKEQQ